MVISMCVRLSLAFSLLVCSSCKRDRDCYPMCPAGYAPAPGCGCAPIKTVETADAGVDAKR